MSRMLESLSCRIKDRKEKILMFIFSSDKQCCCKEIEMTLNVTFNTILPKRNVSNFKPAIAKWIISFFDSDSYLEIVLWWNPLLFQVLGKTPTMRFISPNFRHLKCKLLYLSFPSSTLFIADGEKAGLLGYDSSCLFWMASSEERNSTL